MYPRVMYSRVGVEAGLDTLDEARAATAAVLHALRDRLTPREAEQAAAQLPAELKDMWRAGSTTTWPPIKMHRRDFLERVKTEAGLADQATTERVVDAVFAALKDQLSDGESDDILAQLPGDLKRVWVQA
jgi:uncharacterized protein (DUF2267 family)